jgi:hypothetical protein
MNKPCQPISQVLVSMTFSLPFKSRRREAEGRSEGCHVMNRDDVSKRPLEDRLLEVAAQLGQAVADLGPMLRFLIFFANLGDCLHTLGSYFERLHTYVCK